mmetsp:Transcript_42226/g.90699  ORF Transcript_42226/g.90699 Transcript_42226/m.90699 type:complete len:1064 (-) Transcript_42226:53-3244(-)
MQLQLHLHSRPRSGSRARLETGFGDLVCKHILDLAGELLSLALGISQKHLGVLLVEYRIVNVSISSSHCPLHENGLLCLPHLKHRHASNRAIFDFLCSAVRDVIGSNNDADIGILHIWIDLLHLQDPVVGNSGLCQEHIHLTRHSASDRMDSKAAFDTSCLQGRGQLGHRCLCSGNSHAIARDDDHRFCRSQCVGSRVDGGLHMLPSFLDSARGLGLHAHATEDDIHDIAIHGIAHNLRQDCSAEADKRANGGQHRRIQQEALSYKGPTRVGIQHCDAAGHVSSPDRSDEVDSHGTGKGCGRDKFGHAASSHEGGRQTDLAGQHAQINIIFSRQGEGCRGHVSVEFGESDQATSQSDTTDEVSKNCGPGMDATDAGVNHVRTDGGNHGCQTDERVESSNSLGQGNGAHLLAENSPTSTTSSHQCRSHGDSCWVHACNSGCQSTAYSRHSHVSTHLSGLHVGQSTNGTNTQQRRDNSCRFNEGRVGEWCSDEHRTRSEHQVGVVLVARLFEKVQHALAHDEPTNDVHGRDSHRGTSQDTGARVGSSHQHQTANSCGARNGIGNRHEGRVQSMGNSPNHLVPCRACQGENTQLRHHGCVTHSAEPHAKHTGSSTGDDEGLVHGLLEGVRRGSLLLGSNLLFRFGWGRLRGWRHRQDLTVLAADDASGDDVARVASCEMFVDVGKQSFCTFLRGNVFHKVEHILGVHLTCLLRHSAWSVRVADDGDTVVGDILLTRFRHGAVAASSSSQVHDDRPRLHVLNHVVLDELRRGSARDCSCGDDDVAFAAVLREGSPLGFEECSTGLLGIATFSCSILFEVHCDPLGSHGNHLIADITDIPSPHDRTKGLGGAHSCKSSHTAAQNHGVGRRVFASRSDLRSMEALEDIGCLENSSMPCQLSLGGEDVELLSNGDSGGSRCVDKLDFGGSCSLHNLLARRQETSHPTHHSLAAELRQLIVGWRIDREEYLAFFDDGLPICHNAASLFVLRVGETSLDTRTLFHLDSVTFLDEMFGNCWHKCHSGFVPRFRHNTNSQLANGGKHGSVACNSHSPTQRDSWSTHHLERIEIG